MKYTVDTVEQDLVVLLKESDESIRKDVPIEFFPKHIKDGDVVVEILKDGRFHYDILKEETDEKRRRAEDLLKKLLNKNN